MQGSSYRLKTPTLGIISEDGHRKSVIIPIGAVVRVISGPLDNNRLVDVIWEDKSIMMFTQDVRERGEQVDAAPVDT